MKFHNEEIKKVLAEKLLADLEEELEGICKYDCLYKMFFDNGFFEEATTIEKIASDEYKHADKIWRMLDKFSINVPPKIDDLWDKVEEIFDK